MHCVIHVGLHHTATTSFQKFLFKNRDAFIKNKILYPLTGIYRGSYQQSLIPSCFLNNHLFISEKRSKDFKKYMYLL